jgi:hypothetical protein
MPTNLLSSTNYFGNDVTVLATELGLRSPRMLTLDLNYIAPDSDGNKILQAGALLVQLESGYGRVYPAAKASTPTATSSNVLTVPNPSIFKAGDVIKKTSTSGTTIGTVQTVNTDGTLTLEANAAAAVATGDTLVATDGGVVTSIYGMNLTKQLLAGSNDIAATSNDIACYTSASVYGDRLPFWSSAVQAQLPEITLVAQFPQPVS